MMANRKRAPLRAGGAPLLIVLFLFGFFAEKAAAQELQHGNVTYVTSTSAYVNMGTRQGFAEGDTVRILEKNGSVAAILAVEHLSSSSMSAKVLSKQRTIVAGDAAEGIGSKAVQPVQPALVVDSTKLRAPTPEPVTSVLPQEDAAVQAENKAHGRISLQYYLLDNSTTAGLDFSQPAAVFNVGVDRIAGAPLYFSMYSNHRYDARAEDARRGVNDARLRNRVYEFSLRYGALEEPFQAALGRFLMHAIGGVGTIDGAMAMQRFGNWEAGIAGGSQPGYRESEVAPEDAKFAGYVRFTEGDYGGVRYQGSLAYAQIYRASHLDRGFVYMQNTMSFGNSVSFYQNLNFDMHDLVEGVGQTSPHLTDLFISGNYRPIKPLAITGSYALRRSVYLLESFSGLSAQYFNKAHNQNFQVGLGYNIGNGMFANLTASLRTREDEDENATAYYGRYTFSNLFSSGFNVYLLGSLAENKYNRSTNMGFEINRDLIENLYTSLRVQQVHYSYLLTDRQIDRLSASFDAYYRVSRAVYLSLSFEHSFETAYDTDRVYTEATWRF